MQPQARPLQHLTHKQSHKHTSVRGAEQDTTDQLTSNRAYAKNRFHASVDHE
jgi:hypothetical protein